MHIITLLASRLHSVVQTGRSYHVGCFLSYKNRKSWFLKQIENKSCSLWICQSNILPVVHTSSSNQKPNSHLHNICRLYYKPGTTHTFSHSVAQSHTRRENTDIFATQHTDTPDKVTDWGSALSLFLKVSHKQPPVTHNAAQHVITDFFLLHRRLSESSPLSTGDKLTAAALLCPQPERKSTTGNRLIVAE